MAGGGKGSGSSGGDQVVGYKYYFSLLMALCRGPVAVIEIRAGNLPFFDGSLVGQGHVKIDRGDLFGGNDKEGGIEGDLYFLPGKPDQVLSEGPALATLSFPTNPSIGDTVTINGELCTFTAYSPPPPDGGGGGDGGGGDGGGGGGFGGEGSVSDPGGDNGNPTGPAAEGGGAQ
jgi:hypothetical protein